MNQYPFVCGVNIHKACTCIACCYFHDEHSTYAASFVGKTLLKHQCVLILFSSTLYVVPVNKCPFLNCTLLMQAFEETKECVDES